MTKTLKGAVAIVVIAIAIGYGFNAVRPRPLALAYKNPARVPPAELPASEPKSMALQELTSARREDLLLIDARPGLFYRRAHIPGSINLSKQYLARDFGMLEATLRKEGHRRFVVYCADLDCEDALVVARELIRAGLKDVSVFRGGWREWQDAGFAVEKG